MKAEEVKAHEVELHSEPIKAKEIIRDWTVSKLVALEYKRLLIKDAYRRIG